MKRVLLLAMTCLLLGVITTIAVAWGFALLKNPVQMRPMTPMGPGGTTLDKAMDKAIATALAMAPSKVEGIITYNPDRLIISRTSTGSDRVILIPQPVSKLMQQFRPSPQESAGESSELPRRFLPEWSHPCIPLKDNPRMILDARGWPKRALWCRFEYDEDAQRYFTAFRHGGIDLGRRDTNDPQSAMALPLRPLIAGFALNTLFYAALWLVPIVFIACIVDLFRAQRVRAGQCASCGYDLRELPGDTCPECGARRP